MLQHSTFTAGLFYALPFCSSAVLVLEANLEVKLGQIKTKLQLQFQIKLVNCEGQWTTS